MRYEEDLKMNDLSNQALFIEIRELINSSRNRIVQTVNTAMVYTYFEIGRLIVEHLQNGKDRADYGKQTLKTLSEELVKEFGNGFSERNLLRMKTFYQEYSISPTLSSEFKTKASSMSSTIHKESSIQQTQPSNFILSWSHYVFLMRIENTAERRFYEIEAYENNWSLRELKRQFDSSLYERLVLSRDKEGVKRLSEKGQIIEKHQDVIKDPYILEFLGFDEKTRYSETELETAIIDKLEHFLLELGKGFLFESRQKRFTFEEDHFYVDLVFYNRLLHCYVLIDLKIGELKHQDLGQMQMYVNYFDRYVKLDDEQATVGIILCKQKKDSLVEITLPKDANIHAAKYQTYLPDKQELKKLIEETE